MSKYTLLILPAAEKQIQKLPKEVRTKIIAAISQLGDEPRPAGYKK